MARWRWYPRRRKDEPVIDEVGPAEVQPGRTTPPPSWNEPTTVYGRPLLTRGAQFRSRQGGRWPA